MIHRVQTFSFTFLKMEFVGAMATNRTRIIVNLEPEVGDWVKARAKHERRSNSNFIEGLVVKALNDQKCALTTYPESAHPDDVAVRFLAAEDRVSKIVPKDAPSQIPRPRPK